MKTRSRSTKPLAVAMTVGMVAALLFASPTARAQIGNQPTIRHIALVPSTDGRTEFLAMVGQSNNNFVLIAAPKFVDHDGGDLITDAAEVIPYTSDTGAPLIENSWGAVDTEFLIHVYRFFLESDGSVRIAREAASGPFGDPRVDGRPTALAQAPDPSNPHDPWTAIGTDSGRLILIRGGRRVEHLDLAGPIVDLAVVPQVGYFAFVALVNARDGQQHLVGVRPPELTADPQTPAQFVLDLTSALHVAVSAYTSFASENGTYESPTEPSPVHLIATNGTRFIHRLTIPANPTIGGTFRVRSIDAADVPITHAAVGSGSLALLPVGGEGVLFDPNFRVDRGGVSGKLLTIFGSSVEVRPRRLSLQGRRRFVTGVIEVAEHNAAQVNPATIELQVGDGGVPASAEFTPKLGDADRDGNTDLTAKFDRAAVQALIPPGANSVLVTARWLFRDGSRGSASAELRIKSDGDDEEDDGVD